VKAIVLAGGPAKQLRYVTGREGSRSLLRFPSGFLLDRILGELQQHFDNIIVVSDDPLVESMCRERGCVFAPQQGSGIEAAICSGLARVSGDEFITIVYGDIYASRGFIDTHVSGLVTSFEPTITVTKPLVLRGSFMRLNIDPITGTVIGVGEGQYVHAGLLSVESSTAREQLCSAGAKMELMVRRLVEARRLRAIIWMNTWLDIDTPWDYLAATRFDLLEEIRSTRISTEARIGRNVVIEGPVVIEKDAVIDHNAVIKGPSYIGAGSFIGVNSFIRGGTVVYSGAKIGAFTEVKRSIVYDDASIYSFSYVADSIVGRGAKVSAYTVTQNVPYEGVSGEVVIMSTHPLEKLKVGSIIAAGSTTRIGETIPPATIYRGA
jgi:glucose-1-phosphate thymidylyltransferase